MSQKLCKKTKINLRNFSEVILWENSSPTADFPTSQITLNDSLMNYDRIRIKFRTSSSTYGEFEVSCKKIVEKYFDTATDSPRIGLNMSGSSYQYSRPMFHNPDDETFTTLNFRDCYRTATSTNPTTKYNQYCVPLFVYGIKISEHLPENRNVKIFTIKTIDWSNSTVSFNGEDCYYAEYPITYTDGLGPVASITSSSNNVPIEEQIAYLKIDYVTVDNTNMLLKLYAKEKPTTSFSIIVRGVR